MKTQRKKLVQTYLLVMVALIISCSSVFADDLNPPSYRGAPLSVYVHWHERTDPSDPYYTGEPGMSEHPDWDWVDDEDPSTTLFSDFFPSFDIFENPTGIGSQYQFTVPNIIDELPLKLLRIQLTWVGTTAPPLGINAIGSEGTATVPGTVTHASVPNVYTQPDGGYQYFDIEFRPNPDFELIHVDLPENAELVQVVIDSISTVPEPTTIAMLALGGFVAFRKRRIQ